MPFRILLIFGMFLACHLWLLFQHPRTWYCFDSVFVCVWTAACFFYFWIKCQRKEVEHQATKNALEIFEAQYAAATQQLILTGKPSFLTSRHFSHSLPSIPSYLKDATPIKKMKMRSASALTISHSL